MFCIPLFGNFVSNVSIKVTSLYYSRHASNVFTYQKPILLTCEQFTFFPSSPFQSQPNAVKNLINLVKREEPAVRNPYHRAKKSRLSSLWLRPEQQGCIWAWQRHFLDIRSKLINIQSVFANKNTLHMAAIDLSVPHFLVHNRYSNKDAIYLSKTYSVATTICKTFTFTLSIIIALPFSGRLRVAGNILGMYARGWKSFFMSFQSHEF